MALSVGFAPIGAQTPRCLILGSMPGVMSLSEQQYYAHPRNAFWPIMTDFLDLPMASSYRQKQQALSEAGIQLWDVLATAEREGSLDSAIVSQSLTVNDFSWLLDGSVESILCNGSKAYDLFIRHVFKPLALSVAVIKLPSTSPAYAAMTYAEKQRRWILQLQQSCS